MELPIEIRQKIEELAYGYKTNELKKISDQITDRYTNDSGKGKVLVSKDVEALVYSIVRMPATHGAVSSALGHAFEVYKPDIKTVLDLGAGVGTASIAVSQLIKDCKFTLIERETAMIDLGKKFIENLDAEWIQEDYTNWSFNKSFDLVVVSYSLNELSDENRAKIVEKLWQITNKMLIIVEPGTPVVFSQMKEIRTNLINKKGYIVGPCTHCEKCPIKDDDWCHFSTRVQRSKLQKLVKGVEVPFEDEKFTYLAISKEPVKNTHCSRILRHPIITKVIDAIVCDKDGIKNIKVSKKDDNFKKLKKSDAGDLI